MASSVFLLPSTVNGVVQPSGGGTGITSYAIGDLIVATAATTLASLPDVAVGQVLASGGVGAAPAYTANPAVTSLTLGTSGILQGGANLIDQRNGTNAQEFRLYNTFTDASNYSRLDIKFSSNVAFITGDGLGTGAATSTQMVIGPRNNAAGTLTFRPNTATNAAGWNINSAGLLTEVDNTVDIGASAATRPRTLYLGTSLDIATAKFVVNSSGIPATVNSLATAGNGVGLIVATNRVTAQAGAAAAITTYTPAADASFEISGNVLVTTATNHTFTMTCTYTDEGNTARTQTMSFVNVAGTAIVTSIANAAGAVPYNGIPIRIRAKAATAITFQTVGTFTTVAYNAEALIKRMS